MRFEIVFFPESQEALRELLEMTSSAEEPERPISCVVMADAIETAYVMGEALIGYEYSPGIYCGEIVDIRLTGKPLSVYWQLGNPLGEILARIPDGHKRFELWPRGEDGVIIGFRAKTEPAHHLG